MAILLTKLDLFLKEETNQTYEAYSNFDRIKRDSGVSMADYIIDLEQSYSCMHKYKMELPDAVLAFELLDTAYLALKDRQLSLTACADLTFMSIKSALKRIFARNLCATAVGINQESAYLTEQRRQRGTSWPQNKQPRAPLPGTNPGTDLKMNKLNWLRTVEEKM